MKTLALTAGAAMLTVAASAFAQVYYTRPHNYDPSWSSRSSNEECWNPRARHYEGVRPGEAQNDLDFSRCRTVRGRSYAERNYADLEARVYGEERYPWQGNEPERQLYKDSSRGFSTECWNAREDRWEVLHPGEIQDNLDKNRCRPNQQP